MRAHALPGGGNGLIRTLASSLMARRFRLHRRARPRHLLHAHDEVHVDAADHDRVHPPTSAFKAILRFVS